MKTWVALLRGVNLGSRNKVPMAALRAALEDAGFEAVSTHIQSGNVFLRAVSSPAARIEKVIAEEFGVRSTVVVRTPAELRAAVEGNPFPPDTSHVMFLSRKPAAKAVASLDPERSPPDEFEVRGREIYLDLPRGFHRSKLTIDYFERRLGVNATLRNWRTVLKLVELTTDRS